MMALLDLGLFVINARLWNEDRARCTEPMDAMAIHASRLKKHPIRLLWSDDFFEEFPWSQPQCPVELRDVCTVVQRVYDHMRSNERLVSLDDVGNPPSDIRLDPDILGTGFSENAQLAFSWLLSWAVAPERGEEGLAIPTWPRDAIGEKHEVRVLGAQPPFDLKGLARLLLGDADWQLFIDRYQRPNLQGRRVAVLGGSRAPFERARKTLVTYGIEERDVRRLPPAYEETREKKDTLDRLKTMDLLLVCTNRLKHTDTDHVKGELPCGRVDLNSDGDTALVDAVVTYFRDR